MRLFERYCAQAGFAAARAALQARFQPPAVPRGALTPRATSCGRSPNHFLIGSTDWSPLSGSADTLENYHVGTCELAEGGNHTTLIFTHRNSLSQQDADSLVERVWKPIPQALKQLVEGASQ